MSDMGLINLEDLLVKLFSQGLNKVTEFVSGQSRRGEEELVIEEAILVPELPPNTSSHLKREMQAGSRCHEEARTKCWQNPCHHAKEGLVHQG